MALAALSAQASDASFSFGLGTYNQSNSAFTRQWTESSSDLDGEIIAISYHTPLHNRFTAGFTAGMLRADARQSDVISAGDASSVDSTVYFLGPEIGIEKAFAQRFALYGRGGVDYYNCQFDFRYEDATSDFAADDNKHAIGAHVVGGARLQLGQAGGGDSHEIATAFSVYAQVGYFLGKVSSADEEFVRQLNSATGSTLSASDHDIEGTSMMLGLELKFP